MIKQGKIIKCVGGVFTVLSDKEYVCFSPKKFRFKDGEVLVGDNVTFEVISESKGNLVKVSERKNKLSRPEIANVDVVFVVIAKEPVPDLFLVDKILVNCFKEGITPVVVVNKSDLGTDLYERAKSNYSSNCDVVCVSSLDTSSLTVLRKYFDNKTVCFAGQSAVGKTSLLNAFLPDAVAKTGGLSDKTGRGMHTTRHSSIHSLYGGYLVDTCGFSLCDINGIKADELRLYFDEFTELSNGCKFTSCTHVSEPDCAVKNAVSEGTICKERYERYVFEYNELKETEKNKY